MKNALSFFVYTPPAADRSRQYNYKQEAIYHE